jgi:nitroreductase
MIKDIVESSRSYRSFKSGCVIEKETLLDLVDIARKCPAAMNTQVLKYRLVTEEGEKNELISITLFFSCHISLPPTPRRENV